VLVYALLFAHAASIDPEAAVGIRLKQNNRTFPDPDLDTNPDGQIPDMSDPGDLRSPRRTRTLAWNSMGRSSRSRKVR